MNKVHSKTDGRVCIDVDGTIANKVWRSAIADLKRARKRVKRLRELRERQIQRSTIQRYDYGSITDVCVGISMQKRGSSDGMTHAEMVKQVDWLRWRLDNWTDTALRNKHEESFDNAVRNLVIVTLELASIAD